MRRRIPYPTIHLMLSWRQLRVIVKSKPPIPTGLLLGVLPAVAIVSTWVRPLAGIGTLSPWLKIAYFATVAYYLAFAI